MENNWPETIDELLDECQRLISKCDLYTLGEYGEPFADETEPRVDGTEYLAGEYQYGVAMVPAQWVTHVLNAATLGSDRLTVGQVQKAIERHFGKVAVLDDGGPVEWRDDWVCRVGIDYRGITDELNGRLEQEESRLILELADELGVER